MEFIDYFKILGVTIESPEAEIKIAYRKLSKKFHPDVNNNDKYFEERFKEIQEAYEVLTDKRRRDEYILTHRRFYQKKNLILKKNQLMQNSQTEKVSIKIVKINIMILDIQNRQQLQIVRKLKQLIVV
jgi:DnaJ-class molecular chaperone